jgi:tripartite-type tricarboxylate transporter receptor subunit TctC
MIFGNPGKSLGCLLFGAALIVATTGSSATADAQSADAFFKSTQLTMYVGSGAGGGYDVIARVVAHHMSRFIPGNPNFVIKNMDAAAGVTESNYVYNIAPKDGSAISAATNSSLALPLYGSEVAKYDPRKFEWIGSTDKQTAICVTWKGNGIDTLDDAKAKEVTVSATGVSAGPGVYPKILNEMVGTKFKVISGYNTSTMRLALEKQEVDGICGLAWQTYKNVSSDWVENKKINVLVQMGLEKLPELQDVPLATDLIKDPIEKQVLDLIVLPQEFGRPFVAPPGVPADRMAVYRTAFKRMINDEQFKADTAKGRMSLNPLDDKQIEALLTRAYSAPKEVHDKAAVFAAQMQ